MSVAEESELSRDEVDDFLGSQETGVLSLAKGDDPYAIPVSYGYSTGDRRFYFRLVSTPESEKRRYLGSSPHGRVVVYDEGDGEYTSAVAEGVLEEIRRDELDVHHVEQYGDAKRPLFEIWGADKADLDVGLYEMDARSLTGRHVVVDRTD